MSELCGEDFTFVHQPRGCARRGGGVGVFFRKTLHYGDPTCTDATNLSDLLETSGFVQHDRGATDERGNTLDLVNTSDTSHVIATAVKPTTIITDHYAIECELQPNQMRLKRPVEYRNYAAIDTSRFAADLVASELHAPELVPAIILSRYGRMQHTLHVLLLDSREVSLRRLMGSSAICLGSQSTNYRQMSHLH